MSRRRLLLIALGLAALAAGAAGLWYQREAALRERALAAAQRGAVWLSALDAPLKDPGIPWIISAIDAAYCHEPRLTQYVAQRFMEFDGRPHPIFVAMRALALGGKDETFDTFGRRWQKLVDKTDVISAMAYAVYCDRMPRPEAVAPALLSTTSQGYALTHQDLALLYMQKNGCLSTSEQETLEQAARAIAAEQSRDDEFSDLWAERIAMLLYGDHRELVKRSWIERLIAEQAPSGAWSDPHFARRIYPERENPHTTVLAVWALAEQSHACPFR